MSMRETGVAQRAAQSPIVAIRCDSLQPERMTYAAELAQRVGLPLAHIEAVPPPLILVVTDERLELRPTDGTDGPTYSEFSGGAFGYRSGQPLRRELLARAVGFKGKALSVIDLTAGLGRDAAVLALLGCDVVAIERNAVVFALLDDGLRRARSAADTPDALAERISIVNTDACEYLGGLAPETLPDVIYLDPMFPERTHSALAKKEMRALAQLVGAEEDGERLLRAAIATGCHRVVVKRPLHAHPLAEEAVGAPPLQFRGRSARFDVYFPDARPTRSS